MNKLVSMREAVQEYVHDGDAVYLSGFTHGIPFAAAHEIMRQGRSGLTLMRATPDLIYDQMIAAGSAAKVVFSYAGNPGVGSIRAFRRAVEEGIPHPIELEEWGHYDLLASLHAGAAHLPFYPVTSLLGSDLPAVNPRMRLVASPYDGRQWYVVAPTNPDVTFVCVQRATADGLAQSWGITGDQRDAAFAARHVVVVAEEIVSRELCKSDPNRMLLPDFKVDAVVHEPFAAHPSYIQGYYDRDNAFYIQWNRISATHEGILRYLDEWVYGLRDRAAYRQKLGEEALQRLQCKPCYAATIDYGQY